MGFTSEETILSILFPSASVIIDKEGCFVLNFISSMSFAFLSFMLIFLSVPWLRKLDGFEFLPL